MNKEAIKQLIIYWKMTAKHDYSTMLTLFNNKKYSDSLAELKKIVKKYGAKLKVENYPFSAMYLFGSQIKDKAGKYSDIDVAVVSNKLKRNWNRNEDMLWKYTIDIDSRIEPIGFTCEEFEDNSNPIVAEIKRNCIKII